MRKMATCLLDISSASGSPASLELLQRCSLELTGFFVCYWCCNPQDVATLQSVDMQTGFACEDNSPDVLHEDLLVGNACICKVCSWLMKLVGSAAQHSTASVSVLTIAICTSAVELGIFLVCMLEQHDLVTWIDFPTSKHTCTIFVSLCLVLS